MIMHQSIPAAPSFPPPPQPEYQVFLGGKGKDGSEKGREPQATPPPPPPGYCGAFARLASPGGGGFPNFALPGHLPTPGPFLSF